MLSLPVFSSLVKNHSLNKPYFPDAAQIIDEQTLVYQFISVFELVVTVATTPLGICTTLKRNSTALYTLKWSNTCENLKNKGG